MCTSNNYDNEHLNIKSYTLYYLFHVHDFCTFVFSVWRDQVAQPCTASWNFISVCILHNKTVHNMYVLFVFSVSLFCTN